MAFSTLIIIIAAMLLLGGLLGFFLRPSVTWCVHTIRRLYFRPKLLTEHKVTFTNSAQMPQSQVDKAQNEAPRNGQTKGKVGN